MNNIELYCKARANIENKFRGLPYAHTILIYHLMARANPFDGIVTKVNYNDLALLLTIDKAPGRKESGTPTKQTIRNYIKSIEHECGDHFKVISEGQSLKFFFPELPEIFSKIFENTGVNTTSNTNKILKNTEKSEVFAEEVNTDLNTEVNTPFSAVKKLFIKNKKINNNNMMDKQVGNKNTPKPIAQNFYPSPEIIARAIASGHHNATDADIIQEFIDKNTAWGSTFADFNPIYLSFLARHAERKQQESVIAHTKTRSKDNERTSPKINSYDSALEEVRRNNPDACTPSTDRLFPGAKTITSEFEHTAHFMALDGTHPNLRHAVCY